MVVRLLSRRFRSVENIVGERSSTDFGMVFGGGVRFGPSLPSFGITTSGVRKIEGQTANLPATVPPDDDLVGKKANGQFLATTFGVRF